MCRSRGSSTDRNAYIQPQLLSSHNVLRARTPRLFCRPPCVIIIMKIIISVNMRSERFADVFLNSRSIIKHPVLGMKLGCSRPQPMTNKLNSVLYHRILFNLIRFRLTLYIATFFRLTIALYVYFSNLVISFLRNIHPSLI